MNPRLLLLSNSTMSGGPYLGWAMGPIRGFLGNVTDALFLPYAAVTWDYDEYHRKVVSAFAQSGIRVSAIQGCPDAAQAIRTAGALLIGGGNTFRLLERLQSLDLVDPIRQAVGAGTPFVGWSAGANVACPTIMTTNDMPVVEPASMRALGLVRFQLNPHFTEKTIPNFGGETRADRLMEFVTLNRDVLVVGLREGDFIEVNGSHYHHGGNANLELFHSSHPQRSLPPGTNLDFLSTPGRD